MGKHVTAYQELMDVPSLINATDYNAEYMKSKVRMALYKLYSEHESSSNKMIRLQLKPHKGVICKADVAKEKLRLVPLSGI